MESNEFYEKLEDGQLNPSDYVVRINQDKPQPIVETERKYTAVEAAERLVEKGQTIERARKIIARLGVNGGYDRGYTEAGVDWALKELNY